MTKTYNLVKIPRLSLRRRVLFDEMYRQYRYELAKNKDTYYEPIYNKTLKEECNKSGYTNYYITNEDGLTVGFLTIDENAELANFDVFVKHLYIKPNYRRKGYATKALASYCVRNGTAAFSAIVSDCAKVGISFYKAFAKKRHYNYEIQELEHGIIQLILRKK